MNKKTVFQKIKSFLLDDKLRFSYLTELGFTRIMSDEAHLKKEYYLTLGKKLDLDNPVSFNEKIQWLKLHDRKPFYTTLVDKFEVKKYVASVIGEEYIIPTIGVWEKFSDIDFETLPNQFVLKCTHDSGGLLICKDKRNFDLKSAKKKIEHCLRRKYYYIHREWPYKDVVPRIIAEPYIEDKKTGELRDYKFFAFNGEVKVVFVATGRQNPDMETTFDFFDMDYKHLDIVNGHPNAEIIPEKPKNFEKMKELAKVLAKDIPHIRVDFYEVNEKIYFGELTFSHWSGMVPFEPVEWDYILGSWLELPKENIEG